MTNRYEIQGDTLKLYVWDYHAKRNRVAILDAADYDLVACGATFWHAYPARQSSRKWYVAAKVWFPELKQIRTRLLHRWLLGLTDRKVEVHHIDNDGLNNRRSNLRPCTHQQNLRFRQANRKWTELDERRAIGKEYRAERAIAREVAIVHKMGRQGLWKIRTQPKIQSAAARAYHQALAAAGVRSLAALKLAHPVTNVKFGAVRVNRASQSL